MNKKIITHSVKVALFIFINLFISVNVFASQPTVQTGLDILVKQDYQPLLGKRIGIVTNHSALTADGHHIVDLLAANKNLKVTALFCPEHGLRGNHDDFVTNARDEKTGLPVYSLYGKIKKPTRAMLKNVDILVFDIQDIGTRFYTYISTLAYIMQAAKENDKTLIVLDRPNPINGRTVEGPLPDQCLLGKFTSFCEIPVRHAMTMGEMANFYNQHYHLNCKLNVVKMQGWQRDMYFEETKLHWINPSPNMRSVTAAINYPGLGILEGTNLSVGRGTSQPFLWYGAPWINANTLVAKLNARKIPGVYFKTVEFTPRRVPGMPVYPYTNKRCFGFTPVITDRREYRPIAVALNTLAVLHQMYPQRFELGDSAGMLGQLHIKYAIKKGEKVQNIMAEWNIKNFLREREKALLYS